MNIKQLMAELSKFPEGVEVVKIHRDYLILEINTKPEEEDSCYTPLFKPMTEADEKYKKMIDGYMPPFKPFTRGETTKEEERQQLMRDEYNKMNKVSPEAWLPEGFGRTKKKTIKQKDK